MDRATLSELQRLMERLADGDRAAFHPVFAVLWPLLRRFAARHLRPEEAEETAQETLVKIFLRAGEFDPSRSALAWALGIAAFEIRTVRRRRLRRREESPGEGELEGIPGAGPTPEEEAMARDMERMLQEALGALRGTPRRFACTRAAIDRRWTPRPSGSGSNGPWRVCVASGE